MASLRLKCAFSFIRPLVTESCNKTWQVKKEVGLLAYSENPIRMPSSICSLIHTSVFSLQAKGHKGKTKKFIPPPIKEKTPTVKIWKNMTVSELAVTTRREIDDVFEAMLLTKDCDFYDKPNSVLEDLNTIQGICKTLGYRAEIIRASKYKVEVPKENRDVTKRAPADPKNLVKKPPVVTIMGHVDHGKTTLLDTLRHTSLVKNEHGGITQHIGAFTIDVAKNEKVTFLDTPGHAAFSSMRARGAHVTDLVVLVVAADDGVMEQTIESIRYAKEANVPIIVAVNKMDKPKIDLDHVKSGLVTQGLHVEDIGGDVQVVYISALTGMNMEKLIEAILVQAEVIGVKGDPKGLVEGAVLESSTDLQRGKLATALVQRGTLRKGSYLVAGTAWAKVRNMSDEWGKTVLEASPGTPVQVTGWRSLPAAGDEMIEVKTEKEAKKVVEWRERQEREAKLLADLPVIQKKLDEHLLTYKEDLERRKSLGRLRKRRVYVERTKMIEVDTHPRLSILIKGDVDGSVEAILDVLSTYHSNESCILDLVDFGVGAVTENDVEKAEAFNGIIYTFNVDPLSGVSEMAEAKNVAIKEFKVIYKMVDDLKDELSQRLAPVDQEEILGEANVLQQFMVTESKKKVPVAGCRCSKGVLKKDATYRLIRNDQIIHRGPLASIRHLKNEVESVKKDVECGLRFEDPNVTFETGDILIGYTIKKVPQKTNWNPPGF